MRLIKPVAAMLLTLMCLLAGGCASVQPWERGNLAKAQMTLESNPSQSVLKSHIYGSREAAAGGNASQGGGCGCY